MIHNSKKLNQDKLLIIKIILKNIAGDYSNFIENLEKKENVFDSIFKECL
jgi:hypothetical protein